MRRWSNILQCVVVGVEEMTCGSSVCYSSVFGRGINQCRKKMFFGYLFGFKVNCCFLLRRLPSFSGTIAVSAGFSGASSSAGVVAIVALTLLARAFHTEGTVIELKDLALSFSTGDVVAASHHVAKCCHFLVSC